MKKRLPALLLTLAMVFSLAACGGKPDPTPTPTPEASTPLAEPSTPAVEGAMTPGTYEFKTAGHRGEMTVSVTVDETSIKDIIIKNHAETYGVAWGTSTSPVEAIPAAIIANQTLAVDTVAGATITSATIRYAVGECIKQAGGDTKNFQTKLTPDTSDETYDVDVLVIGAGAAGLSAALAAQEAGLKVVILEKVGVTGGSTARSGGKILAAGTQWQAKQEQTDNADMMFDYLMSFDRDKIMNPDLVKQFCDNSLENINWLADRGVMIQNVEPIHSSLTPWRVHNTQGGGGMTDGIGGQITAPLTNKYEQAGGQIVYNCPATELLTKDGAVVGAIGTKTAGGKVTVNAKNTIICAGGYAHNEEMLAKYNAFLPSNAASGVPMTNTGDGITLGQSVGARVFDAPGLQLVYVNYDCYIGIAEESGLIVAQSGKRVVNEWSYQSHVAQGLADAESPVGYYITATKDGVCAEPYPMVQWGVTIEEPKFSFKASSLEELADKIGMDADALTSTVKRYNDLCAKGTDDDFGKPAEYMIPVEGDTYYAFSMYPGSSVTFGGLEINGKSQVLDESGKPITGLYAAGETALTGLFDAEYPCCGMAIGSAVYFGRNAIDTIVNGGETPEPTSAPTATPKPEPTPAPTATPKPESTPAPTATPKPTPEPTPTPEAGKYNPGSYTGYSFGMGDITVTVTVDANNITSVKIDGPNETADIGGKAIPTLEANAKAKGAGMDGVAGATITSDAVREAVAEALKKAAR